jgi:hypothetical protein
VFLSHFIRDAGLRKLHKLGEWRVRPARTARQQLVEPHEPIIFDLMADSDEIPVMLPFQDKVGTGWHVVIRYREGHEREVTGFSSEKEALAWIIDNTPNVDKQAGA